MENATALLIEGEGRFSEYPIARIFKERTNLIQLGLGVHDQFAVIKNNPSPSLVDSTDYRELIYRLLDDIQTLYGSSGWPALRQRVDGYRQAFVSLIVDHVPVLFESARCSAREYNFLRAIETMDIVWHIIPDDFQPYLPPQIDQGEMKRFYQALETRRSVERSWIYTLVRLSKTKLYFNDVLPDLSTKLPEHADVPIKDLESLLEDIHRAVEIEGAIKFLHECDEVIESIYWFQIQGKIHFNFEIDPPSVIVSTETNLVGIAAG